MRKRIDDSEIQKITVDIMGLMQMLSLGRNTAAQVGEAAGAVLQVGRRKLYLVSKIEAYMDSLTKQE